MAVTTQLSEVDAVAQLAFLVTAALERRAAAQQLSPVLARLLGILRDRTLTMNQLATRLELDKSSVTGLVQRAEKRGLLARSPSPTDRRVVDVALTDAGREFVTAAERDFDTDIDALLSHLPRADRDRLRTILTTLLVAVAGEQGVDLFR